MKKRARNFVSSSESATFVESNLKVFNTKGSLVRDVSGNFANFAGETFNLVYHGIFGKGNYAGRYCAVDAVSGRCSSQRSRRTVTYGSLWLSLQDARHTHTQLKPDTQQLGYLYSDPRGTEGRRGGIQGLYRSIGSSGACCSCEGGKREASVVEIESERVDCSCRSLNRASWSCNLISAVVIHTDIFRWESAFLAMLTIKAMPSARHEKELNAPCRLDFCFICAKVRKKIDIFLQVMGKFPIFAMFKLKSDRKSQVSQPAIFVSVTSLIQLYGCTVSGTSNGPGASLLRLEQRVVRPFFYVQNLKVMNQTVSLGEVRPSVLSMMEGIVKNCKAWWHAKSELMSDLTGEVCTHGEVVLTNLCFTAGVVAVAVAGTIFGGF